MLWPLEDHMVSCFFCGSIVARVGVDLLDMVEPLELRSPFGPCHGEVAQGVAVPLAGSRGESWLVAVGFAAGFAPAAKAFSRGDPVAVPNLT